MQIVEIKINNRSYQISCDKGQEVKLKNAAAALDKRVQDLVIQMPQITPEIALVMVGVMQQDEILSNGKKPSGGESDNILSDHNKATEEVLRLIADRVEKATS